MQIFRKLNNLFGIIIYNMSVYNTPVFESYYYNLYMSLYIKYITYWLDFCMFQFSYRCRFFYLDFSASVIY